MKFLAGMAIAAAISVPAAIVVQDSEKMIYSPLAVNGADVKVTPNPGNIWAFHKEITVGRFATEPTEVPILVDFDGNGSMDTNYPFARIMVTEVLVMNLNNSDPVPPHGGIPIKSNGCIIWRVPGVMGKPNAEPNYARETFHTPLVLELGADLSLALPTTATTVVWDIHVLGRIVSL